MEPSASPATSIMSRVFSQKLRKQWRKLGSKSTRRYSTIIVNLTTKQVLLKGRRKCKASRPQLKSRGISRRTSVEEIFDHYRKSDNKTSAVEREKKVQGFEAATEKLRNITKNQRRGDIFIPIAVGGGIALSYFAKKRKNESVVREEIAFREIKSLFSW
mmetsp:Transcript_32315/g.65743  ORF Transcript_32315/g.65743 Transcript_32315/m.65743 type:complete len:159 (+) Transcript_32315:1400-1876(+)